MNNEENKYDIILIIGELFFNHPLSGPAILKRLLEKHGYKVGIIEMPQKDKDVMKLGEPKLFFGITSGSIDSMVRNYTPLKKKRSLDETSDIDPREKIPDRAVIVYSNWVKKNYKDANIVIGGTEATLRRFTHYDYWDNKLRKSILFDTRADILVYGNGEKQILEIAERIKNENAVTGIEGTCIIAKEIPKKANEIDFIELPSHEAVSKSKEKFCEMQNMLRNDKNLAQKTGDRYILQYRSPIYTSKDLDEYYELPFTREIPTKHLRGFEFSVVTHRGCIGNCNFCSLILTSGDKIISRSEESILREIKNLTALPYFKGNVDDVGGPTANMYGMDCDCSKEEKDCIDCQKLDRSSKKLIQLLRKARAIKGVNNVYIRSGIRYDLASPEYLKEAIEHHIFDTLKVAPEHVSKEALKLMNKDKGNFDKFISDFTKLKNDTKSKKELSFYFMVGHPGNSMKEAKELAEKIKKLKNCETVQVFTPTPMTVSTCMYYTGLDPKTKKKIYVPYSYSEKKEQKRAVMKHMR